jgi:hypothetical protein
MILIILNIIYFYEPKRQNDQNQTKLYKKKMPLGGLFFFKKDPGSNGVYSFINQIKMYNLD